MAAATFYTPPSRETPRPDGLCPHCLNPSLKTFTRVRIDWDGFTVLGTRVACTDCRVWIEPLKELAK
ncbi:hypothetical protein QDW42_gp44 [Microbacterium phage Swervy]|uniref:hypothetical protein n=1 Tax=Microbacterium phage QMacho TaxID=2985325 RepID=UPI001E772121|nr:hypothetical protein QDW41_gp46 [Microbacterium phage QMacho]YP_010753748.1 hypothetical protein QDW42_gp44 [Microbacterium phage Swervy]WMI34061.1 hypothetical protein FINALFRONTIER_44 [Microbacterium phage Finalfrontier]WMI34130.1 hypothetical protein SLAY_44 [Microbacterium phage Slay]UAW08631.1 hypothetical protein Swervy_44 [Microbacterium phage Swervy]UYL86703.1 hypothetical protein SEA_QMACHO_46 [Microbacterium phage QMacho]